MSATLKEKINSTIKGYGKKIFVGYLALITGCTSPLQNIEHASTVENKSTHSNSGNNYNTTHNQKTSTLAVNKYNLPSLDLKNESLVTPKEKSNPLFEGVGANAVEQPIANPRNTAQKSQDGSDLQALAMGIAGSESSEAVKNWFAKKHATAELSLGVEKNGVKSGSLDVLMPLYDTKNDLLFTQLGFRRSNQFSEDYRNTVNIGAGYRHTTDNRWILGANSFYDRDLTGKNDRLGLGLEAMTDYLKVSGNSYIRLSDWKQSPDMDYFQERPANGWDLRTEAYLPQYPQLGGKLMYEQYYGEEVGLFGASSRQKDPSATTVGLSYTPIPLISLSTDYRQGQNGLSETSFKIGFNLQLGVPLKKQLSADELRASRLIEHSRYDLVDRRNDIVLDFKENEKGKIALPIQLKGSANEIINFPVNISGPVRNITWEGTAASYAMVYGGGPTASIKLPSYNAAGTNFYTLKAIATDSSGRVVESNYMQIAVESIKIILETSKTTATADGNDFILFTATLTKATGEIIPNADVNWNIQGSATVLQKDIKTNTSGKAMLKLSSLTSSIVDVSVGEIGGVSTNVQGSFIADTTTAKVTTITTSATNTVADGTTIVNLEAIVKDNNNNPLGAGITVNWNTNIGTLGSATSVTDAQGKAINTLKSNVVGTATVNANSTSGGNSVSVNFTIAPTVSVSVVSVTATPTAIPADGTTKTTLVAVVHDQNNVPVKSGVTVTWSTTSGALSTNSSITDNSGNATVTLLSNVAGTATVTANATNGSSNTVVTFNTVAVYHVDSLTPNPSEALADGIEFVTVTAQILDQSNQPAPAGVPITWTTTLGTIVNTNTVTDSAGKTSAQIKSTLAGNATVTTTNASFGTSINFKPLPSGFVVNTLVASPTTIPADNITESIITATIVDKDGNQVPDGTTVTWSANNGTLSQNSTVTSGGKTTNNYKTGINGTSVIQVTPQNGVGKTISVVASEVSYVISTLSASPTTIKGDGVEYTTVTATLKDTNGNPASSGRPVYFSSDFGMPELFSSSLANTDSTGKATVTFKSDIPAQVYIYAGLSNNDHNQRTPIDITETNTYQINSVTSSAQDISSDGSEEIIIEASVTDENSNLPPVNTKVFVNAQYGILSSTNIYTDSNGKARVKYKTNHTGPDGIYATVSGSQMGSGIMIKGVERNTDNGTIKIFNAGTPNKLYEGANSYLGVGMKTSIMDSSSVKNARVRFECISGVCLDTNGNQILKEFEATTDNFGYAQVIFGPSSNYGTAIFRASYVDDPALYINIAIEVVSDGPPM